MMFHARVFRTTSARPFVFNSKRRLKLRKVVISDTSDGRLNRSKNFPSNVPSHKVPKILIFPFDGISLEGVQRLGNLALVFPFVF